MRWNQRLLVHNIQDGVFCKSIINKDKQPPPFFEANSDAMNAFEQFRFPNPPFALFTYFLGYWVVRQTTSRSKALWGAKYNFTTSMIV
jgi:hypothetical protein